MEPRLRELQRHAQDPLEGGRPASTHTFSLQPQASFPTLEQKHLLASYSYVMADLISRNSLRQLQNGTACEGETWLRARKFIQFSLWPPSTSLHPETPGLRDHPKVDFHHCKTLVRQPLPSKWLNWTCLVTKPLLKDMESRYKICIQAQKKDPPLFPLNHGDSVKFIAHRGQKSKTDGEISCFFWRVKNIINHVLRNWQ